MKSVLQLPAYRRLLAAYTLNVLAWSIGELALALLVYRQTGSAIGAAAYFLCAQFVPALSSPILVARLDRRSVHGVLPALYALEAIAFLALAWVAGHFSLGLVLLLTLVDGIATLVAGALARAATVSITRPVGLIREGNAIMNASFSACLMIGPALGGVLVAVAGTVTALLVGAGLFAVIVLALVTASGLPRAVTDPTPSRGRVRAVLAYVRTQAVIRRLLALQGVAVVFFAIAIPVEVVFAQRSLHTGAGGYAALLSAWGAGSVAGSAIYARWRALSGRVLIVLGAGLLGVGYLAMATAPSLSVALLGAVVGGAGNGIEIVAARTTLQEATEDRWMALTMSLNDSIYQIVLGPGILLGGAIAAVAGPRAALATAGAASLAVTAAWWVMLQPDLVGGAQLESVEPEESTETVSLEATPRRD